MYAKQRTRKKSPREAAQRENRDVQLLAQHERLVVDGVVVVLPESRGVVADVAVHESILPHRHWGRRPPGAYLMVMRPMPERMAMMTHNCQNSKFLSRSHPRISTR